MYDNTSYTPRRLIRYGVFLILAVLVLVAGWFALHHGGIKVNTKSSNAEISVAPEKDQNSPSATATGNSLFSIVKTGAYIVTVKDGPKQTKTAVNVSLFKVSEVTLTPPEVGFSEAVTNISTPSFAVSSSSLSLLDSTEDELASVNSNNSYTHSDNTISYESAVWQKAGEGYAVGRRSDTNDRVLVKITGNKPQPITTPKPITAGTYLAFDVTASGDFYLLQDGELFSSKGDGNYQSKGNTNKEASILSVNNDRVAFLYRNSEEQCDIQFLKLSDKSMTKRAVECIQNPSYTYSASWTADDKKLALTTGISLEILDANLSTKTTVPDRAAAHPVWLNNDTLIYTSENNVWSYNTSTNTSSVVATTPKYVSVQSLKKSDDAETLYFTGSADNLLTLYRIQKQGNSLSDTQKIGESNMQTLSKLCHVRYVNFTKIQLVLQTAESTRAECTNDAKNYLSTIGVPLDSFQYDIREEFGYTDYATEPLD
ncbi:hypothetical protein H7Y29_02395 [Microbacteriaceae bacterium]|nr:hypothetical protein [Candidatus Saccharibacteria bacterium]